MKNTIKDRERGGETETDTDRRRDTERKYEKVTERERESEKVRESVCCAHSIWLRKKLNNPTHTIFSENLNIKLFTAVINYLQLIGKSVPTCTRV